MNDLLPRHLILPAHGHLMISTDLHGNLEDFLALREKFDGLRASHDDVHWAILGDLVHGPDEEAQRLAPELYGYPDDSWTIVEQAAALRRDHPDHFHLVLGNHDHGHVGGPHPSKFHSDEVEHLEQGLTPSQRDVLRDLFGSALLLIVAPCGVLLSHGSPDSSLFDVRQVDALSLRYEENDRHGQWLLSTLLTSYGQPDDISGSVLECVSRSVGLELNVVIHGHDRDEVGYYREGRFQLCPVLFGAPRESKRYLVMDLAAHYESAKDFREDEEILRLY
jgi:Calcineurin-like phosphoesterase